MKESMSYSCDTVLLTFYKWYSKPFSSYSVILNLGTDYRALKNWSQYWKHFEKTHLVFRKQKLKLDKYDSRKQFNAGLHANIFCCDISATEQADPIIRS